MSQTYYSAQFTDATRPVLQADRVGTMQHLHTVPLPEDVEAGFEVASPVSRVWAFLLDMLAISVASIALIFAIGLISIPFSMVGTSGLAMVLAIVGFWLLNVGYYFIFEGLFSGQTPGKHLLKMRVIKENGEEIGPREGVVRAFMRFVVIGPLPIMLVVGQFKPEYLLYTVPFSALGLLMFIDPRSRSLSDFIAGTQVVSQRVPVHVANRPYVPLYFQLPHHYFPLNHSEMSKLTPEDYVRLEEFGTRLSTISNESRQHAAMAAAAALASRMAYSKPVEPEYAEIFLFEMHAALKQQLQQLYPDLYQ